MLRVDSSGRSGSRVVVAMSGGVGGEILVRVAAVSGTTLTVDQAVPAGQYRVKLAALCRFTNDFLTIEWTTCDLAEVEFDFNRPTVRIEQNVASLGLALFSQMVESLMAVYHFLRISRLIFYLMYRYKIVEVYRSLI